MHVANGQKIIGELSGEETQDIEIVETSMVKD